MSKEKGDDEKKNNLNIINNTTISKNSYLNDNLPSG